MSASCYCKHPTLTTNEAGMEYCTTCGAWSEAECQRANERLFARRRAEKAAREAPRATPTRPEEGAER